MGFSSIKFFFFFVLFPGSFSNVVLLQDLFVLLLRISFHSNVCEKFDLYFTDFRKAIACLCVTNTAQISTDFVVFVEIYLVKRQEKYITQLNSVPFINITKDLQYYILSKYASNAVFLWKRPPRKIYSTIFHLKLIKTSVPMMTIRTVRMQG